MLIVEIAAYILFLTLIIFLASRALWIVFLLFCYRFWEGIIDKAWVSDVLSFSRDGDYYILIIILALVTYFGVVAATSTIISPIFKYIFLVLMMIYTFYRYDIMEIFFFKDYLEAHGMWGMDYWTQQFKEVFTSSDEEKKGVFRSVWDSVWGGVVRFWEYFSNLFRG